MPNYIVVHRQSNLIQTVICSSHRPKSNENFTFVLATDHDLDTYYRLKAKIPFGQCLDYGALLSAHQKARTKRNCVASAAIPWSRLSKEERELHRNDMMNQLKYRTFAEVAYIFRLSEAELSKFLGVQAQDEMPLAA